MIFINDFSWLDELREGLASAMGISVSELKLPAHFPSFHPLYFSFSLFFSRDLYKILPELSSEYLDEKYFLLVESPDPVLYFHEFFQRLNVIEILADDKFEEFLAAVNSDPGGSPADCIHDRADLIFIMPTHFSWIICADRESGLAALLFSDETFLEKIKSTHSDIFFQDQDELAAHMNL